MPKNRWLTRSGQTLIERIKASEDKEVTWEKGAGWWVGHHQVNGRTCQYLLQLCLLRVAHSDNKDTYIVYELSGEVEHLLNDENYVPAIVRAQRDGQPQFIEKYEPPKKQIPKAVQAQRVPKPKREPAPPRLMPDLDL